jgi:hypothetical protein
VNITSNNLINISDKFVTSRKFLRHRQILSAKQGYSGRKIAFANEQKRM